MAKRILRLPAVMEMSGLSRAAIYDQMARSLFPRPLRIGPRAVGWLEDDIDDWLATRPRGGSDRP